MRRLFLVLFAIMAAMLTGCVKGTDTVPDYNLTIISPSFSQVYDLYAKKECETDKYILCSASEFNNYVDEETAESIHCLTVCDDSISSEVVTEIIAFCKIYNIPVFFLMNDIDQDLLKSYDKAYCVSADYSYIGEKFAVYINSIWQDTLIDRNSDQIFTYSVITPENLSDIQNKFYSSLIKNIKLLGIPLDLKEEIYLSKGDVYEYCDENKKVNECFIILDSSYLPVFCDDFEFYGDGIEVIGMDFSSENNYSDYENMKICLIDYTEYFTARDAVMANIDNKTYPFENIDYHIIDKTIYIEPEL